MALRGERGVVTGRCVVCGKKSRSRRRVEWPEGSGKIDWQPLCKSHYMMHFRRGTLFGASRAISPKMLEWIREQVGSGKMTPAECAKELGVSASTVRYRLRYGYDRTGPQDPEAVREFQAKMSVIRKKSAARLAKVEAEEAARARKKKRRKKK